MDDAAPGHRLGALIERARRSFRQAGIATADLDARLLVQELAGIGATELISRPDMAIEPETAVAIEAAMVRHLDGEPVHRILGWREFYGLRLELSPATLEPRPDTEVLVDAVRSHVERAGAAGMPCRILDLGTGTGAIALALLSVTKHSVAVGTDISSDALAVASRNAQLNGLSSRFRTETADWLEGLQGRFHVIVSNPPYIPGNEIENLDRPVRCFDPLEALDGGVDGLDPYRMMAAGARNYLVEDGLVAVEFGFNQAEQVAQIFARNGLRPIESVKDLGGHVRAALFRQAKGLLEK